MYLVAFIEDITAATRRRSSEASRSLSLLRATLESTADGILVVDLNGKILSFNQKMADMWEIPADVFASGDDERAINAALDKLVYPEDFMAKVMELYRNPGRSQLRRSRAEGWANIRALLPAPAHRRRGRRSRVELSRRHGAAARGRAGARADSGAGRASRSGEFAKARVAACRSEPRSQRVIRLSDDARRTRSPRGSGDGGLLRARHCRRRRHVRADRRGARRSRQIEADERGRDVSAERAHGAASADAGDGNRCPGARSGHNACIHSRSFRRRGPTSRRRSTRAALADLRAPGCVGQAARRADSRHVRIRTPLRDCRSVAGRRPGAGAPRSSSSTRVCSTRRSRRRERATTCWPSSPTI